MHFSTALIQEYQAEMAATYGVAVSANDAQLQLYSLIRYLFGNVGGGAGAGTLVRHRATSEVGDSITPDFGTFGQK
jgi:hypothetical protein